MYKTIAIAGTFDLLHKGHRYFIQQAFSLGEKVVIGLTSDNYASGKLQRSGKDTSKVGKRGIASSFEVEEFVKRKEELVKFLEKEKLIVRSEIVEIDDIYGPAITDSRIEALVVTKETSIGAMKVNQKRVELGLVPLKIITVPYVRARDGKRIASTRIRMGEIDREGKNYKLQITNYKLHSKLEITEEVRQKLKRPQGRLIKGDENEHKKIVGELKKMIGAIRPAIISTVGDEVTKLCNEAGIPINLAIFDFKVKRKKVYNSILDLSFPPLQGSALQGIVKVRNPAGCITKTLIAAVSHGYKQIIQDGKTIIIKILGEDDLAGVPAILLAPLGSLVIYGQPAYVSTEPDFGEARPTAGIVVVEVTEKKKKELMDIMTN